MTTIAAKTMVQGRVSGQGDLTVHGRVRGSIVLDGVLSLEPDGIIEAQASVARALISGVFVGDLYATERIDVTETARIVGNLYTPQLRITAGAQLRGRADTINPIPGEHARVSKASKPAKSPAKTEAPSKAAPRIEAEAPKQVEAPKTEVMRPIRVETPRPTLRVEPPKPAPKPAEAAKPAPRVEPPKPEPVVEVLPVEVEVVARPVEVSRNEPPARPIEPPKTEVTRPFVRPESRFAPRPEPTRPTPRYEPPRPAPRAEPARVEARPEPPKPTPAPPLEPKVEAPKPEPKEISKPEPAWAPRPVPQEARGFQSADRDDDSAPKPPSPPRGKRVTLKRR